MIPRQLSIDLPRFNARGREDFMTSPANARALALVDLWPAWPEKRLALIGPEGAGKSHLAAIWAEDIGARRIAAASLRPEDAPALAEGPLVVEDADRDLAGSEGEHALFHLWNACAAAGKGLLLTGRTPPKDWPVALPDLASRLSSLTPAVVSEPDEALLSAVLVKLFSDRQIAVRPALVQFLLPRMERSFAAAHGMVDLLDERALAEGREVDIPLARTLLEG
ncbi:HdaA/DnaA family protein [Jannaschia sp. M317]|uniref:HdaA/DnaA family protein n=1 Tax=Jannaschia sp. M317 TaxID=2867011 RepID=UPI0021A801E0|nr:chromosomal replication initiator DnaA [Jannaschia sp. M317]UWQ17206.1 chromosomal replication initiator DnaA [Jannaschia sp. M317]